ncbi:hypothetical protein [Advenella sp. FME57]|uniref:hypothetical protein n=1 Tax=Advenella sp. FME57 TaxID=2742604 RepID=UPI001866EDAA|nr:hypothetical protein [Advenella sp. FME57]
MPHILTRSLLTILIPGIFAATPWLLFFAHSGLPIDLPNHVVIQAAVAFSFVAILGSIFEGLGSFIEAKWDHKREQEFDIKSNWEIYLASAFEFPPIGYRYLSKLVTNLYFELAMVFAAPCFWLGLAILANSYSLFHPNLILIAVIILIWVSISYFKMQAYHTHQLLCSTRQSLNARLVTSQQSLAPNVAEH